MATFDDVRAICLSLPETEEATWFGTPSFKVKGKSFLRLRDELTELLTDAWRTKAPKRVLQAFDPGH